MLFRISTLVYCLVSLLLFSYSIHAADINIKLRKTDVSELKQQLIPAFEQNIRTFNDLLKCLEQQDTIDFCLEQLTFVSERGNDKDYQERRKQIQTELNQKLLEKNISRQKLIKELKQLLLEAEQVKLCLNKAQTVNELKDCIVQYRN